MKDWSDKVVVETCRFLERSIAGSSTDHDEFLSQWIRHIASDELANSSVAITLERCDDRAGAWWFVASTGEMPEAGERFSYSQGLTGWILRNRRAFYFATSQGELPDRADFVESFAQRECAVAAVCHVENQPYAVVCAVASQESAIEERSAKNLGRAVWLLEAWLRTSSSGAGPLDRAQLQGRHRELVPGWLRGKLPSQYVWANWWRWSARDGRLHPVPLPTEDKESILGLKAMGVGEGFVGRVAKLREPVYEPRLVNGTGQATGIDTPFPRIVADARIKSIYATPVQFNEEFFGVLAILGEVPDQFDEADFERIESVVKEFAVKLNATLLQRHNSIRRKVTASLLKLLVSPPTPKDYWGRLREVLGRPSQGLWRDAHVFVRNRSDIKASYDVHAVHRAFDLERIDPAIDPFLRDVTRSDGVCNVSDLADSSLRTALQEDGLERIWIGRHSPKDGGSPEFVAMVSLSSHNLAEPVERDRTHIYEQIFEFVYATTRAVLGAAELLAQKRARDQMVTLETHEFRQPIAAIRQQAQFLREDKDVPGRRAEEIIKQIDTLERKAENIMYSSLEHATQPGLRNTAKLEPIDLHLLVAEVLVEARRRAPGQSLVFVPQESPGYWVLGRRRWLLLVVRNVLDNAVKFGQGNPIKIRLRETRDELHRFATIEVRDLGIGIPRDELTNIFTAGHQVPYTRRHVVTGSQTALSVTRDIVQDHDGRIWAESEVKKGACFFIKLPIRKRSQEHEHSMG